MTAQPCHGVVTTRSDDVPEMKLCRCCGVEKPVDAFGKYRSLKDGRHRYCKPCVAAKTRAWRERHPGAGKDYAVRYHAENRESRNAERRAAYWSNHDEELERLRRYRTEHPEKVRAAKAAWRAKNADLIRERRRQWRLAHRDELRESRRAYLRAYYAANAERIKARVKAYSEANPDAVARWKAANRVRHGERYRARQADHYRENKSLYIERNRRYRAENPERYAEWNTQARQRRRARLKGCAGSHTREEWREIVRLHRGRCAHCGSRDRITKDHIIPLAAGGTDFAYNLQPLCFSCNASKGAKVDAGIPPSLFDRREAAS